ncbi:MAG: hypothetical protein HYU30_07810 [Chloroflexi bacterium]|nr:hypothetical protein [Chloroflexota bacterium]
MDIIPVAISVSALLVTLFDRLWLARVKPFKFGANTSGVFWMPPARPDTPFSLLISFTLANDGARAGWVTASSVLLWSPRELFKLGGVALVDVGPAVDAAKSPESAEALHGSGIFAPIRLAGYSSQEVAIYYLFGPAGTDKTLGFSDPRAFTPGRYFAYPVFYIDGKWISSRQALVQDVPQEMLESARARNVSANLDSTQTHDTLTSDVAERLMREAT